MGSLADYAFKTSLQPHSSDKKRSAEADTRSYRGERLLVKLLLKKASLRKLLLSEM